MKTQYIIKEAHSSTSEQEINKAKRLYRKGIKTGEIIAAAEVIIQFSDVNYDITARFIEKNTYVTLGVVDIN